MADPDPDLRVYRGNSRKSSSYRSASIVPFMNVNAPSSTSGAGAREGWLAEALEALAEIDDEIREENLPAIHDATKAEAERLVRALARHPGAPAVYPTQDAEIAIHFKSPDSPDTVVILLNNAGQADCYACTGGRNRRAPYDSSSDLPDGFVLEQLRVLAPGRAGASVQSEGIGLLQATFESALSPMW